MPGAGYSPDAASKAAARRAPLILSGFDRHRQLDIDFQTVPFGAIWLRRTYTNEHARHTTLRTSGDEAKLQFVRYGNNITVLFKACLQLRHDYDGPDFWPAIARGLGASADVVRDMVKVFTDARRIYRSTHPVTDRTGANFAVDNWDDFIRDRRFDVRCRPSHELYKEATTFFKSLEGRQVDLGGVLPKKVETYNHNAPYFRKRSASPETSGPARSPKRRRSSSYFDRPDPLPFQPPQPPVLAPLSAGLQIKGSAPKQEYQTPTSALDQAAQERYFAHKPSDPSELWHKVRGTAQKDKAGTPSADTHDSTPHNISSDKSADEEKWRNLGQSDIAAKNRFALETLLSETELFRDVVAKVAYLEAKVARSHTPDLAFKAMQTQITSLEQEVKVMKEENAVLKGHLSKTETSASLLDKQTRNVQQTLASLEDKMLVDGTTETKTKLASLDSRLAVLEPKSQEDSVPAFQQLSNKLACLEDKVAAALTKVGTTQGDQPRHRELWSYAQRLEDRITKVETKPDESKQGHVLESEVQILRDRLDAQAKADGKKEYASKGFVQEKFKQLENRQVRESEAAAKHIQVQRLQEQIKNLQDKVATEEIQVSRLSKTLELLSTPRSPFQSQDIQWKMDDMQKKLDAVPTVMAISEMITKSKQSFQTEIDRVQRKMDDWPKNTAAPSVSEKIFQVEKHVRAEFERHERDINGHVEKHAADLRTMQAQIKGFNKLLNAAAASMAKSESVTALADEINALKSQVATVFKRCDGIAEQSSKPAVTVEELSARLEEIRSEIANQPLAAGSLDAEALKLEWSTLGDKFDVLQGIVIQAMQVSAQQSTFAS